MSNFSGMTLEKTKPTDIKEALWWEETCVRRQGGYDLDKANLPEGLKWLAKGTFLSFDKVSGKAKVVKSAKVYEKAEKAAVTLKVYNNPYLKVGDVLAGSTISAISIEGEVATLTVSALANTVTKDAVVSDVTKDTILLGLSYDTVRVDLNYVYVTPTLQAYEIEEDSLPTPVNDDIKMALGALHQFKIQ